MKMRFNGIRLDNGDDGTVRLSLTLDGVALPFKSDADLKSQISPLDGLAYRFDGIMETIDPLDSGLLDQVIDDFEAASFAARWHAMEPDSDAEEVKRLDAVADTHRAVLRALLTQLPPRIHLLDKP